MTKKITLYCHIMVVIVSVAVTLTACKAKQITHSPEQAAPEAKDQEKSLAAAEIMAGHKALSQSATPQTGATTPTAVMPSTAQGKVKTAKVSSNFTCKHKSDCTFTKFSNTPRSKDDCKCAAPCTPYVVNKAEKSRREAANHRLCSNDDWFGDHCPAPTCGFIEFDSFECMDGKCMGMALGE